MIMDRTAFRRFFNSEPGLFLILFFITAIVRSLLFTVLELDHDVSTYLVMANEWLRDSVPFTFYIDVKPIGIYALFALAIKVFGTNVYGVRILGIIFISLTAYFIHRILRHQGHDHKSSSFGAILFIVMISLHKWSWASNTEIFFMFFSTWGLYLLMNAAKTLEFIWFGLVMGVGFVIKYHVLFDFTAFGLFYIISHWKDRGWICVLRDLSVSFIALLVPFALCHLYYFSIGSYDEFLFASFVIPSSYSNPVGIMERASFFGEFLLSFAPFVLLILIAIFRKTLKRTEMLLHALWLAFAWIAIFMTGKRFFHYYIQAIPALALLAAAATSRLSGKWLFEHWTRMAGVTALLVFAAMWSQYSQLDRYRDPEFRKINQELQGELGEKDKIYIQQANVLYLLFDKEPMQRYVHNTLMFDSAHIKAFGIDNEAEYSRIMLQEPEHLIMPLRGNPGFDKEFMDQYEIEHYYSEDFVHWSRKSALLP